MIKKQKSVSVSEALQKLEHYCAYQDRCHKEVEEKLHSFFLIPEAKAQIITHLIAENYLNETRFAESFARGKFRIKKWGRLRIKRELKQRHISDYNLKKAMLQINEAEYLETFHALALKKWESLGQIASAQAKQKFITYLQYRGWENNLIFDKWNAMVHDLKNQ